MKLKSLLLLSFGVITFNIYSQQNVTKKENILIIAELSSYYFNQIEDIFPNDYVLQKEYFKYSQIRPESIISPEKNISCIVEIPIKYDTKFGKIEKTELHDYETKYFYNENGLLYKIIQEKGVSSYQNYNEQNKVIQDTIEISLGNYGELISKQNSYENNSNGISKITKYNKNGDVEVRIEIFYNPKGQIIKYDTYNENNKLKHFTKSFTYNTLGYLIKSTLIENYVNELKIIPRRDVLYNYSDKLITSKSMWNNYGQGMNSVRDFTEISTTLEEYINKKKPKITLRDRNIQEVKSRITKRWKNSEVDYEYLFKNEPKINNWEEKKIFNKLYKQIYEKEQIYSIKREYISKEQLNTENKLTETRDKLNTCINDIKSNKILKTNENSIRFTTLNVDVENFCDWIRYDGQYSLGKENNCSKEIVDFYKYNSSELVKKFKTKIDNKILNNEELNLEIKEILEEYQKIIDQTIEKIKNRKIIVDSLLKDQSLYELYKNPAIAGSPTFANNSRDPYEGFKKEDLYFAYKKLYKSFVSEIDISKYIQLQLVQDKLVYLEPLNTKILEKTLRNEQNLTEIVKIILNFKVE